MKRELMIIVCCMLCCLGCVPRQKRFLTKVELLERQVMLFSLRTSLKVIRGEMNDVLVWNAYVKQNTDAPLSCLGDDNDFDLSGTYSITPDLNLWEKVGAAEAENEVTMILVVKGIDGARKSRLFVCKNGRCLYEVDEATYEKHRRLLKVEIIERIGVRVPALDLGLYTK